MRERQALEKKVKFSQRLADFIQRQRFFILLVLAFIIITPIVIFGIDAINRKLLDEATNKVFTLEKKLSEYQKAKEKEPDSLKTAKLEKEVATILEETINQFGTYFAGLRALRIRADLNIAKIKDQKTENKNDLFLSAIKDLLTIPQRQASSILAPTALMDLGALILNLPEMLNNENNQSLTVKVEDLVSIIREKLNPASETKLDNFQAIALFIFDYLVKNYPKSVHVPEALINMGAIYEAQKAFKEAIQVYDRLESDFALNSWTKLAINRKLKLETEGLIKE